MIGTGYVGLVSGACFADLGNTVWCVDKNIKKINLLNANKIPIFEPGLQEIVQKNYLSGRMKFTNDAAAQNLDFEQKDSSYLDLSEVNPFGEP